MAYNEFIMRTDGIVSRVVNDAYKIMCEKTKVGEHAVPQGDHRVMQTIPVDKDAIKAKVRELALSGDSNTRLFHLDRTRGDGTLDRVFNVETALRDILTCMRDHPNSWWNEKLTFQSAGWNPEEAICTMVMEYQKADEAINDHVNAVIEKINKNNDAWAKFESLNNPNTAFAFPLLPDGGANTPKAVWRTKGNSGDGQARPDDLTHLTDTTSRLHDLEKKIKKLGDDSVQANYTKYQGNKYVTEIWSTVRKNSVEGFSKPPVANVCSALSGCSDGSAAAIPAVGGKPTENKGNGDNIRKFLDDAWKDVVGKVKTYRTQLSEGKDPDAAQSVGHDRIDENAVARTKAAKEQATKAVDAWKVTADASGLSADQVVAGINPPAPKTPTPTPEKPVDNKGTNPKDTTPKGTDPKGTDPKGTDPKGTDPKGTTPKGTTPTDNDQLRRMMNQMTPTGNTPSGNTPSGGTPKIDTPSAATPTKPNVDTPKPADDKKPDTSAEEARKKAEEEAKRKEEEAKKKAEEEAKKKEEEERKRKEEEARKKAEEEKKAGEKKPPTDPTKPPADKPDDPAKPGTPQQPGVPGVPAAPQDSKPPHTVKIGDKDVTFPSGKTAALGELLSRATPDAPVSFANAAAQSGIELPPAGQNVGEPIGPQQAKVGDSAVDKDGKMYLVVAPGEVIGEDGKKHPFSDLQFNGQGQGFFRMEGIQGDAPAGAVPPQAGGDTPQQGANNPAAPGAPGTPGVPAAPHDGTAGTPSPAPVGAPPAANAGGDHPAPGAPKPADSANTGPGGVNTQQGGPNDPAGAPGAKPAAPADAPQGRPPTVLGTGSTQQNATTLDPASVTPGN